MTDRRQALAALLGERSRHLLQHGLIGQQRSDMVRRQRHDGRVKILAVNAHAIAIGDHLFDKKELLKAAGFQWDKTGKTWMKQAA